MGDLPQEQFSAFIVFPARVYFDRQLSSRAKLFYGLLSSMCHTQGYAWAKNRTMMRFLGVKSDGTVRKLLRELRDRGYITIDSDDGSGVRRIWLTDVLPRLADTPGEKSPPPGEKSPDPRRKIAGPQIKLNNINNNISPLTPQGEGTPDLSDMSPELAEAVTDWLQYKKERRVSYQPTGLKQLLTRIRRSAAEYGDAAVIDVISQSMASSYQGIVWDRLKKSPAVTSGGETVTPDDPGDWY